MDYTPIVFPDGRQYSSEEIGWVVEHFQNAAERSIIARRDAAKYHQRLRSGDSISESKELTELSPKEKFIRQVRACHDYNWIVAVALARNEIDPMHDLRVRLLKTNRPGGSTFDIMKDTIDSVLRDPQSSYADRARAKDYLKIIEDMGKKWNPKTPVAPNLNVGVAVQVPGKTESGDTEKPIITISDLRKENQ